MEGDPSIIVFIVLLIVTFILSSIFSIVKLVFSSIDERSIAADDEYLRFYASKVELILKNELHFRNTVSFGRTFANAGFAITAYIIFCHYFPYLLPYQKVVFPFLISLLFLTLFSYDIPRAIAKKFYRNLISLTFNIYKITSWLFLPFVSFFLMVHKWLLSIEGYDERLAFLSDEDKARISEKNNGESLDEEEKEMIRGIFDLSETSVDEIMVPRIDMKGLDITTPLGEILRIIRNEGHSRLPVFKETIDSVIGVLYAKDILGWFSEHPQEEWDIEQLIKKPLYVPIGKKVNDLMGDFKKKHMHLAIVVDEYGGTAGLVTMEDILEEIVGDIQDEYDEEEKEIVQISENSYYVDPHIDIDDLNDELDINLDVDDVDYNTLSGLIYHEYGDVPQQNASFDFGGLHITIVKMDNQRIDKVKIDVIQRSSRIDVSGF